MILAGDELGRTQGGNNNAYCQDNRISWLDWERGASHRSLMRFFRLLIAFRRSHNLLRYDSFTVREGLGAEIHWHGFRLGEPDWSHDSHSLAMHLRGNAPGGRAEDIFLIANAHWEAHDFELPPLDEGAWCGFVDTGKAGDEAIQELDTLKPLLDSHRYRVESRGMVVLVASGAA